MKSKPEFPELKKAAFAHCEWYANSRFNRLQKQVLEIREALQSETKSTAGDKHETGRAMLQLEREKLGKQLLEAETMKQVLSKIDVQRPRYNIGTGTLVITTDLNYFVGISAGEFTWHNLTTYCISAASPIGQLLMGKTVGENYIFRNNTIEILAVY